MQRGDNNLVSLPASTGCWMHSAHIQSDLDFFFFIMLLQRLGKRLRLIQSTWSILIFFNIFMRACLYFSVIIKNFSKNRAETDVKCPWQKKKYSISCLRHSFSKSAPKKMALLFWKGTQPFLQLWDFSPNGNRLNWLFRLYIVHSSHVWIQVVPTVPSSTGSDEFTTHYLLSTKYGRQTQVVAAKQTQDESTLVKDVTAQLIITATIPSAVYNVMSGSVVNRKSDRTVINCVSSAEFCPFHGLTSVHPDGELSSKWLTQ